MNLASTEALGNRTAEAVLLVYISIAAFILGFAGRVDRKVSPSGQEIWRSLFSQNGLRNSIFSTLLAPERGNGSVRYSMVRGHL